MDKQRYSGNRLGFMGKPPRDLAPNLFRLAWRKNNTVVEDIRDQNWTRGLWRMSTADEMAEFIHLWDLIQNVQLLAHPDSIQWRWTANGCYSAKLAYLFQFHGSFRTFNAKAIWKAHAEGKQLFFLRGYWFSPKFSQLTVCFKELAM
jgi:hypothetical protein